MNEAEAMVIERQFFANVYQKFPLVIVKGRGAVLWDINGREFIDCMGGYGVCIVGHCHPKIVEAVKNQCEKSFRFPLTKRLLLIHYISTREV